MLKINYIQTLLSVILCLCLVPVAFSQDVLTEVEPEGGVSNLSLRYFKINFTAHQRKRLENTMLEFIYSVDEHGEAVLEKVNGITDSDILDSLHNVTPLPHFQPKIVNGTPQSSLYFMQLSFPAYQPLFRGYRNPTFLRYKNPKLEDFEYIHKSGGRMDILFGGIMNTYAGNVNQYLALGGGFKADLLFKGKKGIGWGMSMNFFGNRLKKNYPITTPRKQNDAPVTMLVGLAANTSLLQTERTELNLQVDLHYALQNVITRESNIDPYYLQFNGFSPSVAVNYILQIGRNHLSHYYSEPVIVSHNLNIHGAVRPIFFREKFASGIMFEVGLAYRLQFHFIREYKLKDDFFQE